MTTDTIFFISAFFGVLGWIGFCVENITDRMNMRTRWKDLTNLQWAYCYAMAQFGAAIVVFVLYNVFKA
jgi:hypothetical protein